MPTPPTTSRASGRPTPAPRDAAAVAGVLLAGGSGERMRPLTAQMNKHLIPVHMRPMIEYALGTLLGLGIGDVCVITGRRHMGQVVELLGSGRRFGDGVDLTYRVQEEALGIAHALGLAERFAAGRRVAAMLGDNVFDDPNIVPAFDAFAGAEPPHAACFLARVEDPRAYGVATLEGDRVVQIDEKPDHPASDRVVTGLYLYPPDVFGRLGDLKPSARGELEITDINDAYAREGRLRAFPLEGWFDAGEPGPWIRTQRWVAEHPERFGPERFTLRRRP